MTYAIRGGYYKWFRGHYVNEEAEEHDYKIPYQDSYMVGLGLGIRFPINDRQGDNKFGINLTFNYDYIGANTKWEDENIANDKVSISVGFDFYERKNYKKINVYSQNDFVEKMYRLGLYSYNVNEVKDDKAFISIIGTEECRKYYLEEDTNHWFSNCTEDNVLNLEFDDVNEDIVNWKGHTFYGITDEQAEQIVDFIEKHKGKNFYISCRAGKSRSQAVARYILDMYGKEYGYNEKESCRKENPCKTPNINVLTKLKRTYYKKFNIYES